MTRSIHTDRYAEFRRLLVAARRDAELTQTEVAERLGKPQSYISKYESGERRLDVVELLDVAAALSADAVEIVRALRAFGAPPGKRR